MINRREFFLRSAATAGAAAFANFPYHLYAGTTQKKASDRIKLGPMKVEVSRLAQGSGTDGVGGSSNQTRKLGMNGLANLFDAEYLRRNDLVYIGSPKTVAEKLRATAEAGVFNVFLGEFNFADLPAEDVMRSIRLFGEQVMPALREYEPF